MADTSTDLTKASLLTVMDSIWRDLDGLLEQFDGKLDTRMPVPEPSWTGRQFLGHLLGALQTSPYYLMQPRDGAPLETVLGDPYWRQIYTTATLASFRAMLFAAHIGMVMLVETADEVDLQAVSPTLPGGGTVSALEIVHFNYHVHLRSHVEDLKQWVRGDDNQ
jgi:hypothetical protein